MKFLVAAMLLALSTTTFAQDNPSVFTENRTTSGEDIVLVGGVPPFNLYEENNGTFSLVQTTTGSRFTVNSLLPNTSQAFRITGNNQPASSGVAITVFSNPTSSGPYADVSAGAFAASQIQWMKDNNLTNGCGNGNFCPNDPLTRAQMAVFLKNFYDEFIAP